MTTAYIWKAEQTEPGMHGVVYTATQEPTPPEEIKPVFVDDGLIEGGSLYDSWELVGTVAGQVTKTAYGDVSVIMGKGVARGQAWLPAEIVQAGWYKRA